MKKCPFCAEEIQAAAIVCKHCSRDLVPAVVQPKHLTFLENRCVVAKAWRDKKKTSVVTWVALIVFTVIGFGMLATYFGPEHQRFIVFSEKRAAWFQRCDARREAGRAADPVAYDACNEELNALMAEAKREGWTK